MTSMHSQDHLSKLLSCYTAPPKQKAVGSSPEKFVLELGYPYASSLQLLPRGGKEPLERSEVRHVCQNPLIDVLVAYSVVMRWGGRNPHNFRLSIAGDSRPTLEAMLNRLRGSTRTRSVDFAAIQAASRSIKGLGISFYTKLLFFFRADEDAYILDQWTAKSAKLLFDPPPVELAATHFPSPNTKPEQYERFCTALEDLRGSFSPAWTTGEEVERALFSAPGGNWRLHVKKQDPTVPTNKTTKPKPKPKPSTPAPCSSQKAKLAHLIAGHHKERAMEDISLPSDTASVVNVKAGQPRINCGRYNDLNWQYNVNAGSIVVQANLHGQTSDHYRALEVAFGVPHGTTDFGDGITGNGSSVISIKVEADVSAEREWQTVADKAVEEMNRLHERITSVLT